MPEMNSLSHESGAQGVSEGRRRAFLGRMLYRLYGIRRARVRSFSLKLLDATEGGQLYSLTMREIFRDYHKVNIGLYSMGGCFKPGVIDKHTTIGRYCSFATSIRVMNRNHPLESKSTHAFFYNPRLSYAERDQVSYIPLDIGNDVWIGFNALIMPHVRSIGTGAVIAAGAVVHKDVPPYAVFVGNPGRVVRYRFSQATIEKLLSSRWWEASIEELRPYLNEFQGRYEPGESTGEAQA